MAGGWFENDSLSSGFFFGGKGGAISRVVFLGGGSGSYDSDWSGRVGERRAVLKPTWPATELQASLCAYVLIFARQSNAIYTAAAARTH